MEESFQDISAVGELLRLTDLKKDMDPFFNQSGDRIYFTRLLIPTPADTEEVFPDAREKFFSLDFSTKQLFILEGVPQRESTKVLLQDSLPVMIADKPIFGFRAGDSIYFCAINRSNPRISNIYLITGDSLTQLTFGGKPSYLQAVSPDGHFIAFAYGESLQDLVLMDARTLCFYRIPKGEAESSRYDFAPSFSPDGKFMAFLRSGDLYQKGEVPFGDIWLVTFKEVSLTETH